MVLLGARLGYFPEPGEEVLDHRLQLPEEFLPIILLVEFDKARDALTCISLFKSQVVFCQERSQACLGLRFQLQKRAEVISIT
jgi:hypothetical protein